MSLVSEARAHRTRSASAALSLSPECMYLCGGRDTRSTRQNAKQAAGLLEEAALVTVKIATEDVLDQVYAPQSHPCSLVGLQDGAAAYAHAVHEARVRRAACAGVAVGAWACRRHEAPVVACSPDTSLTCLGCRDRHLCATACVRGARPTGRRHPCRDAPAL